MAGIGDIGSIVFSISLREIWRAFPSMVSFMKSGVDSNKGPERVSPFFSLSWMGAYPDAILAEGRRSDSSRNS